ncbi:MAG: DNA methyltransferase, partial [Planctomycetota bacterium]
LQGDGPCSGPVWCVVARPRTRQAARWRSTPAWYDVSDQRHHSPVIGGKPLGLMGALIRDYSEPGDLICDPCAGGATTLLAARDEGRRAVGAEVDPETYDAARERIDAGWTPRLF